MLRYILFLIFGIILFLIFNHRDNFSIGVQPFQAGYYNFISYTVDGTTRYVLSRCSGTQSGDQGGGGGGAAYQDQQILQYGYLNQEALNNIQVNTPELMPNIQPTEQQQNDPTLTNDQIEQIKNLFPSVDGDPIKEATTETFGPFLRDAYASQAFCMIGNLIKMSLDNLSNANATILMKKILRLLILYNIDIMNSIKNLRVIKMGRGGNFEMASRIDHDVDSGCSAYFGRCIDINIQEIIHIEYFLELLQFIGTVTNYADVLDQDYERYLEYYFLLAQALEKLNAPIFNMTSEELTALITNFQYMIAIETSFEYGHQDPRTLDSPPADIPPTQLDASPTNPGDTTSSRTQRTITFWSQPIFLTMTNILQHTWIYLNTQTIQNAWDSIRQNIRSLLHQRDGIFIFNQHVFYLSIDLIRYLKDCCKDTLQENMLYDTIDDWLDVIYNVINDDRQHSPENVTNELLTILYFICNGPCMDDASGG